MASFHKPVAFNIIVLTLLVFGNNSSQGASQLLAVIFAFR